ncbi:PAP2 superfamily protein [Flavobacterium longum]|uniref:hypothetical protein n=1 Tax=Flavobacterium longum TaxID=1299340 RepID=UPI0039E89120
MNRFLAFFSYLFHPLFIPLYTTVCFFVLRKTYIFPAEIFLLIVQVIIVTILIPMAFYFLLKTAGKADSVMLADVRQRRVPLLLQTLLILLLLWQSISPHRVPELFFFFLGALVTSAACLGFALAQIRVSLHMAAMAAMLLFVIGLSIHAQRNAVWLVVFLLLVTGLTASSRLEMKAHDFKELILGFSCGLLPQVGFWFLWL